MTLVADEATVVTGVSSSNGRAIAPRLAEHGADGVVTDIPEVPCGDGAPPHELIEADASAAFVECDGTNVDELEDVVEATEAFGGDDVVATDAGYPPERGFREATTRECGDPMDADRRGDNRARISRTPPSRPLDRGAATPAVGGRHTRSPLGVLSSRIEHGRSALSRRGEIATSNEALYNG